MEKKELHVVYIITKLELGGAQKVCLSLFEGLKQSGHTSLLISGQEGPLVNTIKHHPSVYLLPDLKREISCTGFYHEAKNFLHLVRYLKTLRRTHPQLIVHTHSTKAGIIGRWAAFFAGIKNRIHTIHGYAFHDFQNRLVWFCIYFIELLTSFITSHFVCVSSTDVQTGVRLFPQFKNKYSIIRAAVDWEKFYELQTTRSNQNSSQETKKFVIGTISCFKKQKNLPDLIRAFNAAYQNNSNLRLEIIGDGITRSEIENLISSFNLTNVVTLHGWQSLVAPLMLSWNAFALTSLWEGLPCALVEARLLKLPVLSYNTGGIHDVIVHGKNGFLYKQKDWNALAQGIIELSTNHELYKKMQTYNENLSDFSNHSMIHKHIDLYSEFI